MNRQALAWGAAAVLVLAGSAAAYVGNLGNAERSGGPAATSAAPGIEAAQAEMVPSHMLPREKGRIYLGTKDLAEAEERGLVPPGTRSVLQTPDTMRHGQFVWQEDGRTGGPLLIWVDLDRQLVSAFRDGHEIGTSVILYGTDSNSSPLGRFPIKDKREDYHSRTYDAPMPYSLWLTDDGVAVHGSDVRWGRATHGCVGVPVAFARRLFAAAQEGDVVQIVRSSQIAAAAPSPRGGAAS